MKNNLRALSATALLLLGFSKASSKIQQAAIRRNANADVPSAPCLPCNVI
jgi:hypothetical protein